MPNWYDGLIPTKFPGIWKTKTGYRVRVRVMDPKTGTLKEANQHHEGIRIRDAVARQTELRETLLQSTAVARRLRVREFSQSWLSSKAATVSTYTHTQYAHFLERHLLPVLGDFYFDALTHLDVQNMVNGLLIKTKSNGKRYSRESVADFLGVFRNMTQDAVAQLGLKQDPTLRIKLGEAPMEAPKPR